MEKSFETENDKIKKNIEQNISDDTKKGVFFIATIYSLNFYLFQLLKTSHFIVLSTASLCP